MKLSKAKRKAILLRVARHIERWPHLYSFFAGTVPKKGKACRACMLARAGVMIGVKAGEVDLNSIAKALGFGETLAEGVFYDKVMAAMAARGCPVYLTSTLRPGQTKHIATAIRDVAAAL